jgi:hypothetical protein
VTLTPIKRFKMTFAAGLTASPRWASREGRRMAVTQVDYFLWALSFLLGWACSRYLLSD